MVGPSRPRNAGQTVPSSLKVIDTHTGGEPTRAVLCEESGLDLGSGPMTERLARLCGEFNAFRSATINEPRGSDIAVGAALVPPHDPTCDCGVLFFNNVGPLGMCGHGTIGVVETLRHLGRLPDRPLRLDTVAGVVIAEPLPGGDVRFENVPSHRVLADVKIQAAGHTLIGDIAYGGNWFYIAKCEDIPIEPASILDLHRITTAAKAALRESAATSGIPTVDHIELFVPTGPRSARTFVLCPGDAWDRSPCGTGTSAKVACLADAGHLEPGETWTQESVIGSRFTATYRRAENGDVVPSITGRAFVTGEATLLFDPDDDLRFGWQAAMPAAQPEDGFAKTESDPDAAVQATSFSPTTHQSL